MGTCIKIITFVTITMLSISILIGCSVAAPGSEGISYMDNDFGGGMIEGPKHEVTFDSEFYSTSDFTTPVPIEPGTLTAAEWHDATNWDFWQSLFENESLKWNEYAWKWLLPVNKRLGVTIDDASADLPGIKVELYSTMYQYDYYYAYTDYTGSVSLFPEIANRRSDEIFLDISKNSTNKEIYDVTIDVDYTFALDVTSDISNTLDIMFVIDATGSMSDELEYLKVELKNIITQIASAEPGLTIRVSCNFYRDSGEEYIVRPFPFTTDLDEVMSQINRQVAKGGGDAPEAVVKALENALSTQEHNWSVNPREKLLFLILDAPPHDDYESRLAYKSHLISASEKGVRIIPVAASGIDREAEFLLRATALITGGTYVFLTDDSGVGNEHLLPTVGAVVKQPFSELIIDIVKRYARIN